MPILLNGEVIAERVDRDHLPKGTEDAVREKGRSQLVRSVKVRALRNHADGQFMRYRGQEFVLPLRSLRLKVQRGLVEEVRAASVPMAAGEGGGGRLRKADLEAMTVPELEDLAGVQGLDLETIGGSGSGGALVKRDLVKALLG